MTDTRRSWYLDGVDELPVDVERGHAVLQHAFAHDQHEVVPLALSDQISTAEASTAGQDLVEGGFFAGLIRCLTVAEREGGRRTGWCKCKPSDYPQWNDVSSMIRLGLSSQ